jgi:hypothetical protein
MKVVEKPRRNEKADMATRVAPAPALEVYERPALLVMGNLRDLLAGGGTQTDDNNGCTPGGGLPC